MTLKVPHFSWAVALDERLRAAMREDLGERGDVTSQALVPIDKLCKGEFLTKADGVLCGVNLLLPIFEIADELAGNRKSAVSVTLRKHDGAKIRKGDVVATVKGSARTLLAGERTALNLLCHLSGVASQTAVYAQKIAHTKARIIDTRKTTPLWRDLEKYAVTCGGGTNHRFGLHDMVLIKDNHLALWGASDPAGAVNAARKTFPKLAIEVEVVDLAGLQHVCRNSSPEMILLDNFSVALLREAVAWCRDYFRSSKKNARAKKNHPRPLLEASGGITLETVAAIAETGVDRISSGALTHSVRALDLSLELKI
ncbi:MAG TPA: carboxylating nicotinate-nucleotide diphosphorylase [Planctomycetota bacterium]|jgi:nicotinate-nucleotide pyrophosphorylase (carboxylating)